MSHRSDRFWAIALAVLSCVTTAAAQEVVHLPSVMPPSGGQPIRLASHPDSSIDAANDLAKLAEDVNPDRPPDAKDGMLQKVIFTSTWLDAGSNHGFGMIDLELKTLLGLPIPSRRSPLTITPGFAVHYLDGPLGAAVPPRVYDAFAQFRWWKRFNPQFGIDFAVTPGHFSDYKQGADEAIRVTGHTAAMYEWSDDFKVIAGVTYLDREDIGWLPVGGVIWTPCEDLKFELLAPRPKIAKRIYTSGIYTEDFQEWVYVAGELGGGTWAIRRPDGANDELNYRDFRVILGLSRRDYFGLDALLEIGYVFGRKIEYTSAAPDVEPSDTVMVRGGLTY